MAQRKALVALLACVASAAVGVRAEPVAVRPCGELPAPILALGAPGDLEAFGLSADDGVAVVSSRAPGRPGASVLKFARSGEAPRSVSLVGAIRGLAVAGDGSHAFAVVRETDRKGFVVSVDLVGVDLKTGRTSSLATLPATSRGLAFSAGGESLLVACNDEIRSFRMPRVSSGPLYRVPGDNVGLAPIEGSSRVLVAQRSRLVVVDLGEAQAREGLPLSGGTPVEGTLVALMGTVGSFGPVALVDGGAAWCVHVERKTSTQGAPSEAPPLPKAPPLVPAPPPTVPELASPASPPLPPPPPAAQEEPGERTIPAEPGSLSGLVSGPMRGEVGAISLLGPDNVLREATRAVPDKEGHFRVSGLPPGAYRIVATGRGGRVLICDPPFVTARVSSNSAVEAPALNVLRAP